MAPRQQAQRRNTQAAPSEHVYALGVRGRKTGVVLEDTGERDEYGMEPVDNLFSSPEKGANGNMNTLSDDEEDMDIDEVSTLGPATVARMRRERLSLPKARSPGKTHLNSPARHNPHINRLSSPTRGSYIADEEPGSSQTKSAKRRLDFSKDPKMRPVANGHPKLNGSSQASQASRASKPSRPNGYGDHDSDEEHAASRARKQKAPVFEQEDEEDSEEDQEEEQEEEEEEEEDEAEPMDFLETGGDDLEPPVEDEEEPDEEDEEDDEPEPVVEEPKKRGRKPKTLPSPPVEEASESEPEPEEVSDEPVKKKRGRPGKRDSLQDAEPAVQPVKRGRGRPSLNKDNEPDDAVAEERLAKRPKTEAPKIPTTKGKPGRKRKSSTGGADSPVAPSRPPMPKRRSLVSMRRDDLEIRTTRSGRVSTKPLEFWRGEHYDYDEEEEDCIEDKGGRRIKIGKQVKGVVRVEYDDDADKPKRRRGRPASGAVGRPRRRVSDMEEEIEREEWEMDPGRMTGECIYWYPQFEFNPPADEDQVEVMEEELAISESAIQMKDIKDATFRFAKTMTTPFFGSGIVDLPPHSEKRTKNARKMQMVFFVHYGNVEVTVASTVFRITKGGMWFVPRGNHYSIVNDTDRPARMFFCQGCEVLVSATESQEL
ncbi:hypothetical protein JX266_011825 [Neoarthrinium moseri]|nr:hypothetical protein JX266_011825 [Neoarthrinium moseri]